MAETLLGREAYVVKEPLEYRCHVAQAVSEAIAPATG